MTQLNKNQCNALLQCLGKLELQEMDSDLASAYFAIKRIERYAPVPCDLTMNRYYIISNGRKVSAIKAIRIVSGFGLKGAKDLLDACELECKAVILESPVLFKFSDFAVCKGISVAINDTPMQEVEYVESSDLS